MLNHVGWRFGPARDPKNIDRRAIYNQLGGFVGDLEYFECLDLLRAKDLRGTVLCSPLAGVGG